MQLIPILIVLAIIALFISWTADHAKRAGINLEKKYASLILESTNTQCARNVLLFPGSKDSTEIDIAFATPKGVFCFECKHRKSEIYGSETAGEWQSNRDMANPFNQNDHHIRRLKEAFAQNGIIIPGNAYYNIVAVNTDVVYRKFEMEYDTKITGDIILREDNRAIFTTNSWGVKKNMTSYFKSLPDIISGKQANEINNFLWDHVGSKEELETHTKRVSRTDFDSQLELRRKQRELEKNRKLK